MENMNLLSSTLKPCFTRLLGFVCLFSSQLRTSMLPLWVDTLNGSSGYMFWLYIILATVVYYLVNEMHEFVEDVRSAYHSKVSNEEEKQGKDESGNMAEVWAGLTPDAAYITKLKALMAGLYKGSLA